MSRVEIYTDGSCSPNPGKGGWAYIAIFPDCEFHGSGGKNPTTNNIMEMTAVMEAFKEFKKEKVLKIYSDSRYVINCAQNIWKRKKNVELWQEYDRLAKGRDIVYQWVKGHDGNPYNEMVDKMAKKEVE